MTGEFPVEAVGIGGVFARGVEIVAGDELHKDGEAVGISEEKMALRIVGGAAPVDAANVAGEYQRALQAGRNENISRAGGFDFAGAPLALLLIFAPGIFPLTAFPGRGKWWKRAASAKRLRRGCRSSIRGAPQREGAARR